MHKMQVSDSGTNHETPEEISPQKNYLWHRKGDALIPLAYWLHPGAGLDNLTLSSIQYRALQPHEIRIAVRCVSLNYRDVLIYRGEYPAPRDKPIIPCSDGAGVVVETGSAVRTFSIGDRVLGSFFPLWKNGSPSRHKVSQTRGCDLDGWLAHEVIMQADSVLHIPDGVSFDVAASAPCAGVTAWVCMFEMAKLDAGKTILIQGTGGVAAWAAALAKAKGVETVFITSDESKVLPLSSTPLGVINYRLTPDWSSQVLELTDGVGADLVLEIGGNTTIRESLRAVAFGGHIAAIGGLGGWIYDHVEYLELITKSVTMHGAYVGSARSLADLLAFSTREAVAPHISTRFAFKDAYDAFRTIESGTHTGKILISMNTTDTGRTPA